MTEESITEKKAETVSADQIITEPSQTPLEQEIQKEAKRTEGRSEAEKAAFSLKKNAERARELGIDPAEILGFSQTQAPSVDKDTPLTMGMYEEMQKSVSQKTSLELAESITDPKEKELTIHYLKNRIVPSGDPADDLRFARHAVNSVKNSQIAEEVARGTAPKTFSSGAGAPPKATPSTPELTPAEQMFQRPPFNMTAEQIIAKRSQ